MSEGLNEGVSEGLNNIKSEGVMCSKKKSVMCSTIKPYGPPVSLIIGVGSPGIEPYPYPRPNYYVRSLIKPKTKD